MSGTLRVLPLGVLGEIGKNMMVLEYEDRIVLVDAGLRFPTAEMMGIVHSVTARTTISSLNDHRSSIEPPPRATITRSGRGTGPSAGMAENPRTAAAT